MTAIVVFKLILVLALVAVGVAAFQRILENADELHAIQSGSCHKCGGPLDRGVLQNDGVVLATSTGSDGVTRRASWHTAHFSDEEVNAFYDERRQS